MNNVFPLASCSTSALVVPPLSRLFKRSCTEKDCPGVNGALNGRVATVALAALVFQRSKEFPLGPKVCRNAPPVPVTLKVHGANPNPPFWPPGDNPFGVTPT